MLRISNLTISRGTRRLLEGASLAVHPGHKLGLVGANGSGKSSLFAAIRHELIPDAGSIDAGIVESDAGSIDAGIVGSDAGVTTNADAGMTTVEAPKGCGCSTSDPSGLLVAMSMMLAARRTRR